MDDALESINEEERKERLDDIDNNFNENINYPDYARKLFLIENCIYGVDIQPIATQISRLRFFISLVVDQKTSSTLDNFGIRPLPNLETKFVAANTLIGIQKPQTESLFDTEEVKKLELKLKDVRHRIFSSKNSKQKNYYKGRDKELRTSISSLLSENIGNRNAKLLANWDPYNQNDSSTFFDVEWMFGLPKVGEGYFDIVIGNPPYVDSETMVKNDKEGRELLKKNFKTADGNWDLFVVFSEKALSLCKDKTGILTFIIPNKIIGVNYCEGLRVLLANHNILEIRDYSRQNVFENASVYPVTLLVNKSKPTSKTYFTIMDNLQDVKSKNNIESVSIQNFKCWDIFFYDSLVFNLLNKIGQNKPLGNIKSFEILGSATVGEAYEIKKVIFSLKNENDFSNKHFKFINTGTIDKDISLWNIKDAQYIKEKYKLPVILKSDLHAINKKRVIQSSAPKLIIAGMSTVVESFFDEQGIYCGGKSTSIILAQNNELIGLKKLNYFLNSRVIDYYISRVFSSLKMSGGYLNVSTSVIKAIPVPNIDHHVDINSEEDVFYAYGLSYKEALIINPTLNKTKFEYDAAQKYYLEHKM